MMSLFRNKAGFRRFTMKLYSTELHLLNMCTFCKMGVCKWNSMLFLRGSFKYSKNTFKS